MDETFSRQIVNVLAVAEFYSSRLFIVLVFKKFANKRVKSNYLIIVKSMS